MGKRKLSGDELKARRATLKSECSDYTPVRGGHECQHYAGRGACKREDYFMCVVWLKRNPEEAEQAREEALAEKQRAATEPAKPPPAPAASSSSPRRSMKDQLIDAPRADDVRPPPREARNADVYDLSQYGVTHEKAEAGRPLLTKPELLTEEAIDELCRLGIEVTAKTSNGQEITLVPETTDQDRCELTYRHARTIVMVLQVFPGCTLEQITKVRKDGEAS